MPTLHFQHFRDFFVAQTFEIAQDDRAAKNVGDELQRVLHGYLDFLGSELIERRGAEILDVNLRKSFFRVGIDGDILLQVALEPAAMIESFPDGDAIKPSLQRAALTKTANSLEGFQEDFLSGVGGIGGIAQHAEDQVIDRTVVVIDEPVEGSLRTGLQFGDKFGFVPAPREGAGPIGHGLPFSAHAENRLRRTCSPAIRTVGELAFLEVGLADPTFVRSRY